MQPCVVSRRAPESEMPGSATLSQLLLACLSHMPLSHGTGDDRRRATGTGSAGSAALPFASKMPQFSWATLPVAYHGASYGNFSADAIRTLARFPVSLAGKVRCYGCSFCGRSCV